MSECLSPCDFLNHLPRLDPVSPVAFGPDATFMHLELELSVPYIVAFLIFLALSATWYVSVCAIGVVALTCFVPFPAGYVVGLVAWAAAVYGFLDLSPGRASVLLGYLAVTAALSRLVVAGVLSAIWKLSVHFTPPSTQRTTMVYLIVAILIALLAF